MAPHPERPTGTAHTRDSGRRQSAHTPRDYAAFVAAVLVLRQGPHASRRSGRDAEAQIALNSQMGWGLRMGLEHVSAPPTLAGATTATGKTVLVEPADNSSGGFHHSAQRQCGRAITACTAWTTSRSVALSRVAVG
jgi:hypothetical protein